MRKKEKEALQEVWKKMSTEELDELLHMELQKDLPDDDHVRGILSVLEERERSCPDEITDEVQAAWDKYKRTMDAPKVPECEKPVRGWKWIVGVAAAAALLVVMFIPRTVGAESIFQVLYRWTAETFEFISPGEKITDTKGEYIFETDNPGLQQVHDKVVEMGITDPVVPMWLPEGYELTELKVLPAPAGERVYALFEEEDSMIILSYVVFMNELSTQHEKVETAVKAYEVSEVTHYILKNEDNNTVIWATDRTENSIISILHEDELYKMIKSIYRRKP